jgi:TctA family transporter
LGTEVDIFSNLAIGFSVSLTATNVWYCFLGALIGTFIGVLPGIGPTVTIALLIPLTYKLHTATAIIMLAGIYYGAQYGGSTTSILVNLPGEASSVVTCLDGYQMARKGRAGPALGISAFGSFIAGTIATFGLALLAPPMADFALKFGSPEYFGLLCFGLIAILGCFALDSSQPLLWRKDQCLNRLSWLFLVCWWELWVETWSPVTRGLSMESQSLRMGSAWFRL